MPDLRETYLTHIDTLKARGIAIPDDLKARDKDEPGRLEKERHEDKLYASLRRHWKKQSANVQNALEWRYPERKALIGTTDWIDDPAMWNDPDFEAELTILLQQAAKNGILLFQEEVLIGMDYTLTNLQAAKWARKYAGELIKQIDDTTMQVVRQAVGAFVDTPGFTIGDVMGMLPFDERRAQTVATTEITRSYAQGQMLAGRDLQKEFPDVKVIKTWFTNNDDRVCAICGPADGEEVELDEKFSNGQNEPPAHPNCRCWLNTGTKIID